MNSESRRVSIERFAYDVFSYMLPICGFPGKAISSTNVEENDYKDKDFVKKSALSVFPLSMYVRDNWKEMFELRHLRNEFESSENIQQYLTSTLTRNVDFKRSDDATKVRISLSLFNEITLFFNYKGLETHVDKLPEFWREFYSKHITKNQDIEGLFASSFFMFPEATESTEWIISFVKEFAVPYGRIKKVSHLFSVYSIASEESKSSPLKKTSNKDATDNLSNVPDASLAEASDFPGEKSAPPLLENSDQSSTFPGNHGFGDPSESPAILKKDAPLNAKAQGKRSTRVLELNPKVHQKSSSELGIEDVFGQMSLDSEHDSQEFQSGKPKFKKAGKKKR
ncbi:hypothetical protein AVEN_40468-1 [Araneus ventricosus]|uniref:Uncharacterized protein n=1 Tax=Araneus ventricosus TaxID=182803 RepID=A0A4Y2PR43_ARAVE|nr:hypothetical protein AVEN_40468-1 [Araneus ventricosus]